MKKLALLLFTIFLWGGLSAQYYYLAHTIDKGNPGGINADAEYPEGSGLPTGWTKIDLGAASTARWTSNQTLPFAFQFNGSAVTDFKVSTSGVLTFDVTAATAPSYTKAALPDASIPDKSVCIWGLAGLGANDYIFTKVFGSAPNRQLWIHFNSYSYSAKVSDGSNYTYWAIVLEETTNKIYIVDQRVGGYTATEKVVSAGIQIDGTTAISVTGSPNLAAQAGTSAAPDDNVWYEFINGTQPNYDFAMYSIDIPKYHVLNKAPFDIFGSLINYGATTVTSFDINYSINNGTPVTATINSVSIKTGDKYNFTSPSKWTPSNAGVYSVKVWASNLNGNPDGNTSNDEKSFSTTVVDQMVQRLPLLEVFTSSTCPPCNPGNANLHSIIDNHPGKYTVLKYQQDFPGTGDPYATTESVNRRSFYSINSIPRMEIDGGWDGNANSFTEKLLLDAYAVPSFLNITATYKVIGKNVQINATFDPITNFPSNNLRAFVAIYEKLTTKNIKTNGETEFTYVMKKMITNETGISIGALTKGTPYNLNRSYTFNGDYRLPTNGQAANRINNAIENSVEEFTDLGVLIWVQDYSTREVLQSAFAVDMSSINAETTPGNGITTFYPNPVNNEAYVDFVLSADNNVSVSVFNLLGEQILFEDKGVVTTGPNTLYMDFSNFDKGIYVLKLKIGDDIFTKKFIVE